MQWTYVQKIKAKFKTCKKRFARFYADVNFLAFNKKSTVVKHKDKMFCLLSFDILKYHLLILIKV